MQESLPLSQKSLEKAIFWCLGIVVFSLAVWVFTTRIYHPSPISQKSAVPITGTFTVDIYRNEAKAEYASVYSQLFGGWYQAVKEYSLLTRQGIVSLIFVSIFLLCLLFFVSRNPSRKKIVFCIGAFFLFSILCSVRLGECVDEFFINLRHSYMLANYWKYSVNAMSSLEGSVDFLPLFLTGILGKTGLPMPEVLISFSLFGNLLIIIATYLISCKLTNSKTTSIVLSFILALFPSVIFVGATGFMATLFSGIILLAAYFCLFSKNGFHIGVFFASILSLVRTEGVLFSFLLWIVLCFQNWDIRKQRQIKNLLKMALYGLFMALPFLISCLVRHKYFGYYLPLPIYFKATGGDPNYFYIGTQFFRRNLEHFNMHYLFTCSIFPLTLLFINNYRYTRRAVYLLCILGIFSAAYFSGGGDWLSITWNRYLMPFTVMAYIVAISSIYLVAKEFFPKKYKLFITMWIMIAFPIWYNLTFTKGSRKDSRAFVIAFRYLMEPFNGWERIDRLASFGLFLKETTPNAALIASSEVATIMYFAERELLDLLGVANPDIAFTKINPLEPGDLFSKKRNPETIIKNKPEIIALYEMAHNPTEEISKNAAKDFEQLKVAAFTQDKINTAYFRVGDFDKLVRLGYRHVAVFWQNRIFNYFVHHRIYEYHQEKLKQLGFEYIGVKTINYSIDAEIIGRLQSQI